MEEVSQNTDYVPTVCPECGLPMSIMDDAELQPDGPIWYCDGPNDNTTEAGCFYAMPAQVEEES